MDKMDVKYLINNYGPIKKLLEKWLLHIKKSEYNPHIAEFVIAACSPEMWQTYVCLMGYSEKMKEDPNDILRTIPFDSLFKQEIKWEEIEFYSFALEYLRIDLLMFKVLTHSLFLVFAKASLQNRPRDIDCLEECLRKHDENFDAFWKCLYEERC